MASPDEQNFFISEVEYGLIGIYYYAKKDMQKRHPYANVSSLENPTLYWDIPELENLTLTEEDYEVRHEKGEVVIKDDAGYERIKMKNFTGRELENAVAQYYKEDPSSLLGIASVSYTTLETERNYRKYHLMLKVIMKRYGARKDIKLTEDDYKVRHEGTKVIIKDAEGNERIKMESFTGEELERAVWKCSDNNPGIRLLMKEIWYSALKNEKDQTKVRLMIQTILWGSNYQAK